MKTPFAIILVLFTSAFTAASCPGGDKNNAVKSGESRQESVWFQEDFRNGQNWSGEFEAPGSLTFAKGMVDIVAPKGATLWFRPKLSGPIAIEYQIQAVAEGGPFDKVSDINCFWMATDPQRKEDFFAPPRSGKFEDYNTLRLYYVGLGGNRNTTSRMRRYIGDPVVRPYLPENDLSAPEDLIKPNVWQSIRIVANGSDISYYRDGKRMFHLDDNEPYSEGWFGFRTTLSHIRVRQFRVLRLKPRP